METELKNIRFKVRIVVEPDEKGYFAYCPALKGLYMPGDTEEEAIQNAKDAAVAYIRSLIKHGEPIPIDVVEWKRPPEKARVRDRIEELQIA